MLASARIAALLSRAGRPLSSLLGELPHYVSSPQRRLACPDEHKASVVARVRADLGSQGARLDLTDGVKAFFPEGWGLFRASNTQPAVTMRCEAKTANGLAIVERRLLDAVQRAGVWH